MNVKEYLIKCVAGGYAYTKDIDGVLESSVIEIPKGANAFLEIKDSGQFFYNFGEKSFVIYGNGKSEEVKSGITTAEEFINYDDSKGNKILWQRPSHPEELPFVGGDVNNPEHYCSHPSGIECIEITRHHDFAIGNAIKYLWRAGLKGSDNEIQDLKKAAWYIEDKIKQLENKNEK